MCPDLQDAQACVVIWALNAVSFEKRGNLRQGKGFHIRLKKYFKEPEMPCQNLIFEPTKT